MMAVLSCSPVDLLVTDSRGRQVGRTADGGEFNEIPDANHLHVTNDDGTFVNLIYLPTGTYQVAATGTADGTFHLATATQAAIVNYGEQPIGAGQTATLVLTKGQDQPLRLPDGSQVQPDPGFIETESGLLDTLGRYGPIAGMVVGALLVVVSASLLTRRFVRAKRPPTSSPSAPRTYPPPAAPGVVCRAAAGQSGGGRLRLLQASAKAHGGAPVGARSPARHLARPCCARAAEAP